MVKTGFNATCFSLGVGKNTAFTVSLGSGVNSIGSKCCQIV